MQPTSHTRPAVRWLVVAAIVLAIGIKIGLLFSSQSMADGDEAVEGLMAIHILHGQDHPIYPYGIRYGAGAGLEAHVAALSFSVLGISSPALKIVGLLFWSANLLLVGAIARRIGGVPAALAAIVLFGSSPAAAQWSLKVAGGHQVAVTICLVMVLLIERGVRPAFVVPLAPLAAFAHPIAVPLVVLIVAYLLIRGPQRALTGAVLIVSTLATAFVLSPALPSGQETWNPAFKTFEPLALARALSTSLTTLFSPNLSATTPPTGLLLVVSLLWMGAFLVSLVRCRHRRLVLYALSVPGVALLVDANILAARHLLVLQPIACVILGIWAVASGTRARLAVVAALACLGVAVQVNEIRSPSIYGAGREADGLRRADVRGILQRLRDEDIHYVYNTEPMLQWILMFESHEDILARGIDPNDRVPAYAARVDEARRQGKPIALVVRTGPSEFSVFPRPPIDAIEAAFPSLPARAPAR